MKTLRVPPRVAQAVERVSAAVPPPIRAGRVISTALPALRLLPWITPALILAELVVNEGNTLTFDGVAGFKEYGRCPRFTGTGWDFGHFGEMMQSFANYSNNCLPGQGSTEPKPFPIPSQYTGFSTTVLRPYFQGMAQTMTGYYARPSVDPFGDPWPEAYPRPANQPRIIPAPTPWPEPSPAPIRGPGVERAPRPRPDHYRNRDPRFEWSTASKGVGVSPTPRNLPRRARKGEVEDKVMLTVRGRLNKIIGAMGEIGDFTECLYSSLPRKERRKEFRTVQARLVQVIREHKQLDLANAFQCFGMNQVEDAIIGRFGQAMARENRRQGRFHGFMLGPAL